jgi:hypothetical protein
MPKKKRHSRVEIASKLAQANDLATQGKLHEAGQPYRMRRGGARIAELQLENSRLRRLVTDLLLEKIKLEETAQRQSSIARRVPR